MTTTVSASSLARGREAFTPALRAALARLDPATREMASYHLGFSDLEGNPADGGGKAVRPVLATLSARAAGAPARAGLPGAVAVELVHNFSLLHDDLMDGDTTRRHRRTVWSVWGPAGAILTGDAMLALAQEVLLESGSPHAGTAGRMLAAATRELVRGQVADLAFERRNDVGLEECLRMAADKTGSLLSVSAAIGAVLAGGPAGLVDALAGYGTAVGLAFQLVDDVLGIWGDPATTGKPVYNDLRARKKSLPVTYALGNGAGELAAWLAAAPGGEHSEEELRQVADLVQAAGGRDWALAEADRQMRQSRQLLMNADLPAGPRRELVALAEFIVTREA
jgi:geranylgeranyl diphosphate synthase, type I